MTDPKIVQWVVWLLGATTLLLCGGIVYCAASHTEIPDALNTLAGMSIGGLTGMLISTRSGPADVAPVQVMNEADDPVPVDAGITAVGLVVVVFCVLLLLFFLGRI